MAHDLVIRGGTLYDGTGRSGQTGDLALDGDRITQVGGRAGAARLPLRLKASSMGSESDS